jgi:hypothetical protein
VKGFATLLKPEGVVTFEFPHVLNMIREVQFDTIYHEHFSYLSLVAVDRVLATAGLKAFDVTLLPTHGGSLRLFVGHAGHVRPLLPLWRRVRRSAPQRWTDVTGYEGFADRVAAARDSFSAFLAQARGEGRTVAAYGAAAKGRCPSRMRVASDLTSIALLKGNRN